MCVTVSAVCFSCPVSVFTRLPGSEESKPSKQIIIFVVVSVLKMRSHHYIKKTKKTKLNYYFALFEYAA